ncbi:unnamed protein product [Discula destructiva]
MNDDPTAASDPARLPDPLDDDDEDRNSSGAGSQDEDDAGEGSSRRPQDAQRSRRSRTGRRRSSSKIRRAKAGIAKKLDFMTQLMSSLDVTIYAELSILYYMDCSFFRLGLRAFMQYVYLTPKSEEFTRLMSPPRPHMLFVYGFNILCMLSHLWFAPLEASETMRGYLHGGVIIDFIGQKAPTSRISLLLLDCLILGLQCVMCAVWLEMDQLRKLESTLKSVSAGGLRKSANAAATPTVLATGVDVSTGALTSTQDLDSEERGVLRDDPLGADETNDIEMRPLVRESTSPPVGDEDGREILEARCQRIVRTAGGSDSTEGPGRPSLLDILMSGNGLLANLHIPHALRTLWDMSVNGPSVVGYPLRLTGYGTRIAQLAAQNQLRPERARQQRA